MREDLVIPVNIGNDEKQPVYHFLGTKSCEILKGRIYLTDTITPDTAEDILNKFNYLNDANIDRIVIYLNSPGGCLTSTLSIMDTMQLSTKPVVVINFGIAASGAALVLAAGTPGFRYTYPNSRVMIHCASTEVSGNVHDIKEGYKDLFHQNKIFLQRIASCCKKPLSQIKEATKKDYYMSPNQAKKFGIIDHIITKKDVF